MPEKLDLQQVAQAVDTEGLGYAITDYLTADDIADPELATLWAEADIVLKKIQAMLPEVE